MTDEELAKLEAEMDDPEAWGPDFRYVERVEAEVDGLRAAIKRVRELCASMDGNVAQAPALVFTSDILRALDGG